MHKYCIRNFHLTNENSFLQNSQDTSDDKYLSFNLELFKKIKLKYFDVLIYTLTNNNLPKITTAPHKDMQN